MGKIKKHASGNRHTYRTVPALFALICVMMGVLCFQYYHKLQSTVKAESGGYIEEISKQIGTNVSRAINDNFSVLGTISTVLKNASVTTYAQLQPIVQEQQIYWNYQSILLIDESGTAYDAYGNTVTMGGDEYLRDAVVGKKRSMSASQLVNGKECVVFAIPLDNMPIGGTEIHALAASYDLTTFDQILSMAAFDGQGYAHIIQKDGAAVIRSSSKSAPELGYNILNSIASAEIADGKTMDGIRADIAKGQSGQIEFKRDGISTYMAYTPLETQEWILLTFVPVSVVNAKSELMLKITLLLCGLITFAFAALLAFLMLSSYRHKRKLEQIAYVDPVTGGNTIQRFYGLAQALLDAPGKPQYALVYTNIEKFKVLNEQFGRNACNGILRGIEHGVGAGLGSSECMGRLFADNFCILVEYTDEAALAARFDAWYSACSQHIEKNGSAWLPLIIEFGVYVIGNDSMPFPNMIDRAKLALREAVRELRGKLRYAVYDEQVRRQLFREKQLEDMMGDALQKREFQIYLQPKYRTQSEQIGGAEALVRWASASEGMIYPDEFISLFEKNGFITQLDLWVFGEVCRTIRSWLDAGREPVKVSVNCSRVHLRSPGFLSKYRAISDKYAIPARFIEIELTENVVFEDVEHLTQTIAEIHEAGYGCSMDDFGSGYSSLNLIQDIPVDVLKLDKIFFRSGAKDLGRTESVVGSIISMARALSMETVAEGVEERPQVDMLKRLGCDFIQGYFFARPMPVAEFERLAFGGPAAIAPEGGAQI